jgi:hypothetical protein
MVIPGRLVSQTPMETALRPEHSHLGIKAVYLLVVDAEKIVFPQTDGELPVTIGKSITFDKSTVQDLMVSSGILRPSSV